MLKILKIDLKRAFLNWPVWVGAVLIFLFLLSRLYEDISRAFATNFTQMVDSSLIMFKYALHTSGAVYLFPILCVIPLGTAFCDDYETGFYKLNLLRASPNRYLLSKSLITSLSGAFTLWLGVAFLGIFCYLFFPLLNLVKDAQTLNFEKQFHFLAWLPQNNSTTILYMLFYSLLTFLYGLTWSTVGLIASTVMPNRYVTMASPFILYITIMFITQALKINIVDPSQYLTPGYAVGALHPLAIISRILTIWAILCGIFLILGRRRLFHE